MKFITMTNTDRLAIVDNEDYDRIRKHSWSYGGGYDSDSGYARTQVDGHTVLMHRLVMGAPDGKFVDHIHGRTLDNRKQNLRLATREQNAQNARLRTSKTGYRGVHQDSHGGYIAALRNNGERIYLGYFWSSREAAIAVNKKMAELRGEFARLNEVE